MHNCEKHTNKVEGIRNSLRTKSRKTSPCLSVSQVSTAAPLPCDSAAEPAIRASIYPTPASKVRRLLTSARNTHPPDPLHEPRGEDFPTSSELIVDLITLTAAAAFALPSLQQGDDIAATPAADANVASFHLMQAADEQPAPGENDDQEQAPGDGGGIVEDEPGNGGSNTEQPAPGEDNGEEPNPD